MKILMKAIHLHEVQIAQGKLESRGIPSYINNEYINNIAVMPVGENYKLIVNEKDYDEAIKILSEAEGPYSDEPSN